MKITQVATITNAMLGDVLGTSDMTIATDLSNVVDIGHKLFDSTNDYSSIVATLINHIGKVVFVDRKYSPVVPSVLKDAWEYGSIREKIDCDMPADTDNPKWQLQHGQRVEQDVFTAPNNVRSKFFNEKVTFEIPLSVTEDQLKQSFSSASQLNAFYNMIETRIKNRMAIDYANLIRATINSAISATIFNEANLLYNPSTFKYDFSANNSYVRCINLLGLYKETNPDNLTEAELTALTSKTCIYNLKFLKFSAMQIALVSDHMADMSTLFNIGGHERFTPKDKQHLVLLSEFEKGANSYLQSDTFHNEFVKMPESEVVNFWQGTGDDYNFSSTSRIHVKSRVMGGQTTQWTAKESDIEGVIGVLFDDEMLGVSNLKEKVTNHYNGHGDFMNYWYKSEAGFFNDFDENCVVFLVAD